MGQAPRQWHQAIPDATGDDLDASDRARPERARVAGDDGLLPRAKRSPWIALSARCTHAVVSDAAAPPRAALHVALSLALPVALALAAFALVAPQIAAQDLPWWDEAYYLHVGRDLLAGAAPDLAWSPAYALSLGIARAALGSARAIPVAHALWAAVFAAAVGLGARAILRNAGAAPALAAAALGGAHALVIIGPQRAAISLLLLAFAAMASRRWPRAGLVVGAALALAAACCRLEATFAIPFLLPAAWAASPGAAPPRAARLGRTAAFTAAALAHHAGHRGRGERSGRGSPSASTTRAWRTRAIPPPSPPASSPSSSTT